MSRLLAGIVLAVAFLVPPAGAQDFAGWLGTRWGMTPEEAKRALGGDAVAVASQDGDERGTVLLSIPDFRMTADCPFRVALLFAESARKLGRIILTWSGDRPDDGTCLRTLKPLFQEKYGKPSRQFRDGAEASAKSVTSYTDWHLGDTHIRIVRTEPAPAATDATAGSPPPRRLSIVYTARTIGLMGRI